MPLILAGFAYSNYQKSKRIYDTFNAFNETLPITVARLAEENSVIESIVPTALVALSSVMIVGSIWMMRNLSRYPLPLRNSAKLSSSIGILGGVIFGLAGVALEAFNKKNDDRVFIRTIDDKIIKYLCGPTTYYALLRKRHEGVRGGSSAFDGTTRLEIDNHNQLWYQFPAPDTTGVNDEPIEVGGVMDGRGVNLNRIDKNMLEITNIDGTFKKYINNFGQEIDGEGKLIDVSNRL